MTKLSDFVPAKLDAPFYTDEELDALEAVDPVAATRIAREQAQLQRQLSAVVAAGPTPTDAELQTVLQEARGILARDGGDIEFVAFADAVLTVRLKGSCSGCPRAPLDLKHVVEELVRRQFPQVAAVRSVL
ncbi:MAG: NifU family protein [Burkholderiales bacterium]